MIDKWDYKSLYEAGSKEKSNFYRKKKLSNLHPELELEHNSTFVFSNTSHNFFSNRSRQNFGHLFGRLCMYVFYSVIVLGVNSKFRLLHVANISFFRLILLYPTSDKLACKLFVSLSGKNAKDQA